MAVTSGLAAQFGYGLETTVGTAVTVDHFAEFTDESMGLEIQRIESAGLRIRRTNHAWASGTRQATGTVNFELVNNDLGLLWRAAMGSVTTTTSPGGPPYLHTFTPGDLPSLTLQVGKPDVAGTVRPYSYNGCRVSSWELSANPNEFVRMSMSFVGWDETTGTSLESASYPSVIRFTYAHGSLSVGGSGVCVDNVSVTGDNRLDIQHKICATNPGLPTIREADRRVYGGTATADFESLTQYQRFVDGAEAALALTFTASTGAVLSITGNVRFDGETPKVTGPALLKQPFPFVFTSITSDATAISVALTNTDAAP